MHDPAFTLRGSLREHIGTKASRVAGWQPFVPRSREAASQRTKSAIAAAGKRASPFPFRYTHPVTPDARPHWSHRLPASLRPYALLARWDRPVGYWLLALPGWVGLGFASIGSIPGMNTAPLALLILVGAVAMRGAGCTYNDIVDRELDARVARTRSRPLPSGAVSVGRAWVWLLLQSGIGLAVLLALPTLASQLTALAALPLVAIYPFMKRITGFPQVWLGLTFNWSALVAVAALAPPLAAPAPLLYLGLVAWTLGYDTLYALQDIEDDQLAGIRSSAISFGTRLRSGVALAYFAAALSIGAALVWQAQGRVSALVAVLPFAAHLAWQAARTAPGIPPARALALFKSNGVAGALLAAGTLVFAFTVAVYDSFI